MLFRIYFSNKDVEIFRSVTFMLRFLSQKKRQIFISAKNRQKYFKLLAATLRNTLERQRIVFDCITITK